MIWLAQGHRAARRSRSRLLLAKPGKPRTTDDVAVVLATLEPPPEHLGGDALVKPAAGHRAGPVECEGRQGMAGVRAGALAHRELQVLHRSATGGQSPRRHRACTSTRPTRPSCCARTRNPRPRPWNGPRRCCRCGPGIPESAATTNIRHGTTTLFAALEIATGKVTDACYPRHRHEEFRKVPAPDRGRLSAGAAAHRVRLMPTSRLCRYPVRVRSGAVAVAGAPVVGGPGRSA